jgi:hypothetical protein
LIHIALPCHFERPSSHTAGVSIDDGQRKLLSGSGATFGSVAAKRVTRLTQDMHSGRQREHRHCRRDGEVRPHTSGAEYPERCKQDRDVP